MPKLQLKWQQYLTSGQEKKSGHLNDMFHRKRTVTQRHKTRVQIAKQELMQLQDNLKLTDRI